MYRLVPTLVREMGQAYPELMRAESLIGETLRWRRPASAAPWSAASRSSTPRAATSRHGQNLSGETAFTLYDTYGFPLDLTQDALKARGIGVDTDAFGRRWSASSKAARAAWTGSGEAATETVWYGLQRARRRHRVPRLRDRERRGHRHRAPARRRRGRRAWRPARPASSSSTRRRSTANPAARSAIPADPSAPGLTGARHRHREEARRPVRPPRHRGGGPPVASTRPWSSPSTTPAARRSAPTTRRPTCCTRPCARCSATTSPRRARWSRPDRLRFDFSHPKPMDEAETPRRSRTSPTRCCCRTPPW